MTKFVDSLGLKRLVTKIAEAVSNGTWLSVRKGDGEDSVEEGDNTTASGLYSHAEGSSTTAKGVSSHAEGTNSIAMGNSSHAEGGTTTASSEYSHAEGNSTTADGVASHAQGFYNYNDPSFIDMVGVGDYNTTKNASVIYVKRAIGDYPDQSDPKNGYQYLLGVGGYQGQDITEGMKSVQEVIANLEKGVAATETMTVEDIREIMSA
ncbi:hypothetical protein [Prevotella sp.]|uniref:hypothetical protein n=1 Tax=Prevotella sp. TaxID=59823 RepID=UPI0027E3B227|nr:hypothetical protein [Prevotella sp.]